MEINIQVNRNDLREGSKNKPFIAIEMGDIRGSSELLKKATGIVFVDANGLKRILKQRYQ